MIAREWLEWSMDTNMGNRAVITTRDSFEHNGLGIYVHWNGGRDSVNAFLTYCAIKGYTSPDKDCYGWARLCQVIGNYFGGGLSLGINTIDYLDCDNGDNGTYIIENWEIVGREYFDWSEQNNYELSDMIKDINDSMPKDEQIEETELLHKLDDVLRKRGELPF